MSYSDAAFGTFMVIGTIAFLAFMSSMVAWMCDCENVWWGYLILPALLLIFGCLSGVVWLVGNLFT